MNGMKAASRIATRVISPPNGVSSVVGPADANGEDRSAPE